MSKKHGVSLSVSNLFLYCLLLVFSRVVYANPMLKSGEYIEAGGSGNLLISHEPNVKLTFSMEIIRVNGHSCSLEGEILDGRSILISDDQANDSCVVMFTPTSDGIDVNAEDYNNCRSYCGARADLSGTLTFLRPAAGCDASSLASSLEKFKRFYEGKAFGKAQKVLAPLLANCKKTLGWLEEGQIRNDLAITQYHLGHPIDCLKTLEPLAVNAASLDEELNLAPSDAFDYLPILHAARTNLRLCKRGGVGNP